MPPHCDSLDGPVVTAARRALALRARPTVVRVHRAGEHAPYAGLKPARPAASTCRRCSASTSTRRCTATHTGSTGTTADRHKPAATTVIETCASPFAMLPSRRRPEGR
jgi:hypothetical protein